MLGTVLEVRVDAADPLAAEEADRLVVAEVDRLEDVFSVYREESDLQRWKRGELPPDGSELVDVLAVARGWEERSSGSFSLSSRALSELWRRAETEGVLPPPAALAEVMAAVRVPRYEVRDGVPVPIGDCSAVDLNAIARGYIVDRAIEAAAALPVRRLTVDAGGDLRHRGELPALVGIENPLRPYDDEPPLTTIQLRNAGLATSGRTRRGFRIGDRWYGPVIDHRTGWPVEGVAAINVAAPDAMTADVLATVLGLMAPEEAVAAADERGGIAVLVVAEDGTGTANATWSALELPEERGQASV
jgi:FAD:protein FMN transferase